MDVRDNSLSHEEKRDLIEQIKFTHKLPSTIKAIFDSNDKENNNNNKIIGNANKNKEGKRKHDEDDKNIGKHIDNK